MEILNRRSDNYHNLFSLMAELDLHDNLELVNYELSGKSDDISVVILNGGGEYSSILDDIPVDKNLVSIVVKHYMKALGSGGHFVFRLTKNIPSGAGLGGGSSNAAAALKLVAEVLKRDIDSILRDTATISGSDIPFFFDGRFAFVEGRGESVFPLSFHDECFILLVNNGIHVNTGLAYGSLNRSSSDRIPNCNTKKILIKDKITSKGEWKNIFRNDFESTIFDIYPQIREIKENMYNNGAFFSAMSGSGSTVFGLFQNEYFAINAQKNLEKNNNKVYLTKFRS